MVEIFIKVDFRTALFYVEFMEKNLTSGNVLKNIAYFSLPYVVSYFLQTLYGLADLYIIGQFDGVAEITAVSIGSQIMHMLTVMIVGLAMGSTGLLVLLVQSRMKKLPKRLQILYFCLWVLLLF